VLRQVYDREEITEEIVELKQIDRREQVWHENAQEDLHQTNRIGNPIYT
jgi:hypothetical protein